MTQNPHGGGESARLAPVIPLFGGSSAEDTVDPAGARDDSRAAAVTPPWNEPRWNDTWGGTESHSDHAAVGDSGGVESLVTEIEAAPDPNDAREQAEKTLLKKLRARSLSIVEARRVLVEASADRALVDELVDDFIRRGYLDDAALAEQLVHAGADRKGQGRQAISLALSKRGVPRDIADAAIADLPDDDAERALDFARSKARSLDRVDDEAAFRRLIGALSRRGYGGSVATAAARGALAERRSDRGGAHSSGVRFH